MIEIRFYFRSGSLSNDLSVIDTVECIPIHETHLNPYSALENLLCFQTLSPWPLGLNPHNDSLIHNAG